MFGSDRNRPKDYRRAVVIDAGPKNMTNEDTFRSERRSTLKKRLTEPTLLEMSGGVLAAIADWLSEQSRHVAAPEIEWTNAPYRKRVRSHATTVPPSNGTISRSSASQKAPPD